MNLTRLSIGTLGAGLLLLGSSSCGVGVVGGDPIDVSIGEIVSAYHDYPPINRTPYQSSLGEFEIDVYVSPESAAAYAGIDPARTGSGATVPPGAVIVRQVLGAGGAVEKLTIMAKREAGFNPTCGDWWFGVTDPMGNVLPDPAGVPQTGAIAACASCHIPRAGDDYLFGVPATNRREPPRAGSVRF